MDYGLPLFSSETKLLGLLGHPVGHSKSPAMHNAMLLNHQLPYLYMAFDIKGKEELTSAVAGLKALGARGWNVTVPYKEAILPLLDHITPEALRIGAVNTVVNEEGRLVGYNTDAPGFILSLQHELGLHFLNETVLVIGAGGAARAVVYALTQANVRHIIIANRTIEKATELANAFSNMVSIESMILDKISSLSNKSITLVVNTTSVGLSGEATPVTIPWLNKDVIVSDIIYNPKKTVFLQKAEQKGCRIQNGLGMFLNQGAIAYELWTGKKADLQIMKDAIEE